MNNALKFFQKKRQQHANATLMRAIAAMEPAQLAAMLAETASISRLGRILQSIEHECNRKIYNELPGFKLRPKTAHSFSRFILDHLPSNEPLRILDLGCQDCFLAHVLKDYLHPDSRFQCIDQINYQPNYSGGNIEFLQKDISDFIRADLPAKLDCTVLGGTLSLFAPAERNEILSWVARNSLRLAIREVPRIRNIVEAYDEDHHVLDRAYQNFSESELKQCLEAHDFNLTAVSHEYDIFIFADARHT